MKRVFLIVLDSVGIGASEDAADFGDTGTNTLRSAATSPCFHMPNMKKLGLFNIDGVKDWAEPDPAPAGVYGRSATGRLPVLFQKSHYLCILTAFPKACFRNLSAAQGEVFYAINLIPVRK